MLLYAYRRVAKDPEPSPSIEDREIWDRVRVAQFDTETGIFQLRDHHGLPVAEPVHWRERNTSFHFYEWVRMYQAIWSLDMRDAYWFDEAVAMDEGL